MEEALDRRRVHAIILTVGPDKADVNNPSGVVDRYNQSVIVALDVEHHPVGPDVAGIPVDRLDLAWAAPLGALDIVKPGPQRLLGIGVSTAEIPQRPAGDDGEA